MSDLRQIFVLFIAYLWPWLGPPLAALRHVTYFQFFMDDVIFAPIWPYEGMSIPSQRATSLRHRAQANVPSALY